MPEVRSSLSGGSRAKSVASQLCYSPAGSFSTVLIAVLVLLGSGSRAADVSSACRVADTLRDSGLLTEAFDAYAAVLASEDIPPAEKECVISGLPIVRQRMVEGKIALAVVHGKAGDNEAARAALKEALELDPHSTRALAALAALPDEAKEAEQATNDVVARARALAALGQRDDAIEVIKEHLKSAETSGPVQVPPDLERLILGEWKWLRDARRVAQPWVQSIVELVVLLIAMSAILYILVRFLRWRFGNPILSITEFEAGGFSEEHLGKYFTHSLNSCLRNIKSGSERNDLILVTGPIGAIEIPTDVREVISEPKLSLLSPAAWIQAVPGVLNWIFPPPVAEVTGLLHKTGSRGVGVTLRVAQKNVIRGGYVFWKKDFDDPQEPSEHDVEETLYQLGEYAAVWLLFFATEEIGKKKLDLLGTSDWRSYALFRAGFFAEEDGRQTAARSLYIRALRRDAALRGARVNLGLWYLRHKQLKRAAELFEQVLADAPNRPDSDRDPTFYSAQYNLAVLKEREGRLDDAMTDIDSLLATINAALTKIEQKNKGYRDSRLKEHLEDIKPAAEIMRGGLQIMAGNLDGLIKIKEKTNPSSLSVKTQYNLACFYSVAAHIGTINTDEREQYLQASMDHLNRALQLYPRVAGQIREDRCFEALWKHKKDGLTELLARFEQEGALADSEDATLPLAELSIIGETHATALSTVQVVSVDDLLLKTRTAAERRKLADDLTVSPRTVTRWAHAAELTRVVGLSIADANLLLHAGVSTLGELAGQRAQLLSDDLATLAASLSLAKVPELEVVRSWIAQAQGNSLVAIT